MQCIYYLHYRDFIFFFFILLFLSRSVSRCVIALFFKTYVGNRLSVSVCYNLALFKGIAYKLLLTDRHFFQSWHPCFSFHHLLFCVLLLIFFCFIFVSSITIILSIIWIQNICTHSVFILFISSFWFWLFDAFEMRSRR